MTSDRPYRPGFSHEHAVAELMKFAGTQFDPRIVAVFVQLELPPATSRRASPSDSPAKRRPLDPPDDLPIAGLHLV
jgi:HD-GYP domain-containing protein (c-di-GMP phosphodiesterase class II)